MDLLSALKGLGNVSQGSRKSYERYDEKKKLLYTEVDVTRKVSDEYPNHGHYILNLVRDDHNPLPFKTFSQYDFSFWVNVKNRDPKSGLSLSWDQAIEKIGGRDSAKQISVCVPSISSFDSSLITADSRNPKFKDPEHQKLYNKLRSTTNAVLSNAKKFDFFHNALPYSSDTKELKETVYTTFYAKICVFKNSPGKDPICEDSKICLFKVKSRQLPKIIEKFTDNAISSLGFEAATQLIHELSSNEIYDPNKDNYKKRLLQFSFMPGQKNEIGYAISFDTLEEGSLVNFKKKFSDSAPYAIKKEDRLDYKDEEERDLNLNKFSSSCDFSQFDPVYIQRQINLLEEVLGSVEQSTLMND